MAKLIKGDTVQNIITDGDVIVTSPSKIGKTLDEVLGEQQADIDKLKSNVKYIYAYGGVGGSGSGGSGSTEKPVSVLITLNGSAIGGDTIILDGKGVYKLYIKVSNAGGKNLYMGYAINSAVTDRLVNQSLNGDNKYRREIDVNLDVNGEINIRIDDDEGNTIGYYTQKYIVNSDALNITLNYIDSNGETRVMSEPLECFVNDPNRPNRHFKIDYSIFLTDYSDVTVDFKIDGAEIEKYETNGNSIIIPFEVNNCGVLIGGESILQNKYMGSYTLNATLTYIISGKEVVRTRSLLFTIVPSGLYINVRTAGDVLYDSVDSLMKDLSEGVNKYITTGSSLMLYCKVFEGDILADRLIYPTTFHPFDAATDDDDNIVYDENGQIIWEGIDVNISEDLTEQVESKKGVSVTFSREGIKKIIITTTSKKGDGGTAATNISFEKYVFVKEIEDNIEWYNSERYGVVMDSYFRANQGDKTYSGDFPKLSSGEGVLGLTISSNPIELTNSKWNTNITGNVSTIISLGVQVSNINSEDAKILEVYQLGLNVPKFTLRTTRLFTDINSSINKIAIPTESFDKNENKKYHLIQIIRNYNGSEFEDSLYIDGLLESVDRNVSYSPLVISKIILNNINISYNLINIQYSDNIFTSLSGEEIVFNTDGFAYQYWLSYKQKYVNSNIIDAPRVTYEEKFIAANMHRISFDGTNVEVDEGIILDIASCSQLPSVVFKYECKSEEDISSFMEMMWAGRANGDTTFGGRNISLFWIPAGAGGTLSEYEVKIPETLKTYKNEEINGNWKIDLQGTSTMRNRIKNYSLKIETENTNEKERILFSPKFDINNPETFLPDLEWTIKADIADSAHANNTSIGKFVNKVCTKFDTNIPYTSEESKRFVKNTLEGIPILLYFMCTKKGEDNNYTTKTYYFGVYNFNLGRSSYYNLGYTGGLVDDRVSDFGRVFNNIKSGDATKYSQGDIFAFAIGEVKLSDGLVIGEIQDNYPEFDFHQHNPTVLFKSSDKDNNAAMFGSDSKITANDKTKAKAALQTLVEGVAKAGKYCFIRAGRADDFITSKENGICVNRYDEGKIPDPIYQMEYKNGKLVWSDEEDELCKNVNETDLKLLIATFQNGDKVNKPILNYNSASEYYTICMAFGMVDSVLKNMNLKSFTGSTEPCFHCSFYDMDCALEEDNSGKESVSYLAATDYWYSPIDEATKKVKPVEKKNDYWDRVNGGQGFDFTSSYLLAVIKYAKPIFDTFVSTEDLLGDDLENYPQKFWANLRKTGGELESADIFIDRYFKSGIMSTFEYLASLNYRVKYLYRGKVLDSNNVEIVQPLANSSAFNGSRQVKVKNWLTKRLRFMDVMFNVNGLNIPISDKDTITVPTPGDDLVSHLSSNPDITILHSAFDSGNKNSALNSFTGELEIYAPKHTPFIFSTGSNNSTLYLLPGGVTDPNLIYLSIFATITAKFYGSGMFTSVNKVETMFTDFASIVSDNIEKITYGGTSVAQYKDGFTINAKSATEISMNIPNMGGELLIDDNCISLSKINISNSGFYGNFNRFPNLQEVNISGVDANTASIIIGGSEFLNGEKITISGSDEYHKTKLSGLQITGATGKFNLTNTAIQTISIDNTKIINNGGSLSEFSISGDSTLTSLTLFGFKKVSITSCNNLEELIIDGTLEELYINLEKLEDENGIIQNSSKLKKIYLNNDGETSVGEVGTFDFTNYRNLRKVTLINCDNLEHVKLPDHNVETDGMKNNENLKWVDTGKLPAFLEGDENRTFYYIDENNERKPLPTFSNGSKLILNTNAVFYNCPKYAMLRKDYNTGELYFDDFNKSAKSYKAYTNIEVSQKCTSLSDTFCTNGSSNETEFDMNTAIRFIEICVPAEVKGNITSLSKCFEGRKNVIYNRLSAQSDKTNDGKYHPSLNEYTSLTDISGMYDKTGVEFISKELLDLPYDNNISGNTLVWDSFVAGMSRLNIASDALYNISYRLNSYSYITFNIYEYDEVEKIYYLVGKDKEHMFKICDFLYPYNDGKKKYAEDGACTFVDVTPYNIEVIESLNFGDQYLDFRGMFELFPKVHTLSTFLNGNLSKYNIDGLLKPCTNIQTILYSFCDNSIGNSTQDIDLFNFFNWGGNREDVKCLFEGLTATSNGFVVKKHITYGNFKTVLNKISSYGELTRLNNIFSYCTITEYDNTPIAFENVLGNIINISNLFDGCTSTYMPFANVDDKDKGVYKGGVLNIGRSFFEKLPNIKLAQRTFANTYLSAPLTYDYFCKRNVEPSVKEVLLYPDHTDSNAKATLHEYVYNSNILNLTECFYNTKFVNCKNWFGEEIEVDDNGIAFVKDRNIIKDRNYITRSDGIEIRDRGLEYYIYNQISGSYDKYILDNDIIDDCLDNYTDFVPVNEIVSKNGDVIAWYNHDLLQDFKYYGNITDAANKPFDPENETYSNTIQKTYCCLPPDFFYGCSSDSEVTLNSIFANSNIIGVIPRNLTKSVKNRSMPNIFKNVNIMPNLEYYYNSEDVKDGVVGSGLGSILDEIKKTVEIENGIGNDYTVVFRDENGILKKRKPVSSDRNLGQFVYVPSNFTTSNSLVGVFNFRYNLPRHWEMPTKFTNKNGVTVLSYKSTFDFNNAIDSGELDATTLPYHSQYFFTTDVSVNWGKVTDARGVFISSGQDTEFSNKNTMGRDRDFYDANIESSSFERNAWTFSDMVSSPVKWANNIAENFYVDLNLCGKKNINNMLVDNGCPINLKNSVKLDNFVSHILTVFLNGRVFDETFVVDEVTTAKHKSSSGSSIIGYYGCGKNIILPKFNATPLDKELNFIPIDNEQLYFDFMVDAEESSMSNYQQWLAAGKLSNNKQLFETKYNKYIFK